MTAICKVSYVLLFHLVCTLVVSIPPLGWNSWQAYEADISEEVIMKEAKWFITNLRKYGWEYIVIDYGWDTDESTGRHFTDGNSRTIPNPNLWPSSVKGVGLKAIVDDLHKQDVKVGLHLMRGLSIVAVDNNEPILGTQYHAKDIALANDKCPWDNHWYGINMSHPAGQVFYDSLVSQMAEWGIDFIKVDCLGFGGNQHNNDIISIANAIKKVKDTHTIIYSLSPGVDAQPSDVNNINYYTDIYRITNDLWDCWNISSDSPGCKVDGISIVSAFQEFPKWEKFIGQKGLNGPSFPDGDMLPLSDVYPSRSTSLTEDEKKVLITFWSIFRSPLMIGSKLTTITPSTYSLLTNSEVLYINQNTTGNQAAISNTSTNFYAWRAQAQMENNTVRYYVALFNIGNQPQTVQFTFDQVGIPSSLTKCSAYDVWQKMELGVLTQQYEITLPPTSTLLLRLYKCTVV